MARISLMTGIAFYMFGIGRYIAARFKIDLPASYYFGIGVVAFNIILMPLFFARLLYMRHLLILFAILTVPVVSGLKGFLPVRPKKERTTLATLLYLSILIFAAFLYLVNSLLPVNFMESVGDVASNYLRLPMFYASTHGNAVNPILGQHTVQSMNFEIVTSAIVAMSNPEMVKVFGFALFMGTYFMLISFCAGHLKGGKFMWASLVLFVSPFFAVDQIFSFAHPRVYLMFLTFFAFSMTFMGHYRKDPKCHYIAIAALGVMSGVNYQGLLAAAVNFIFVLADIRLVRKHLIGYATAVLLSIIIAMIFPVWVYLYQGSPVPEGSAIYKALSSVKRNPPVLTRWLIDRLRLQYEISSPASVYAAIKDFASTLFNHYGLMAAALLLVPFFLRKRVVLYIAVYCALNFLLIGSLVPSSLGNIVNARFFLSYAPLIIVLISAVLTEFNPRLSRKALVSLFIAVFIGSSLVLSASATASYLRSFDDVGRKIDYLLRRTDLGSYLTRRQVDISRELNNKLRKGDKVLYLFAAKGIYIEADLFQPTYVNGASVIYSSSDKSFIMSKLKEMGIGYLCVDNGWERVSGDDPFRAIVADITSPLFEPVFFAGHFIPVSLMEPGFYLFRIDYPGITDHKAYRENYYKISESGFFDFIYRSITDNRGKLIRINSNPYSIKTLYETYMNAFPALGKAAFAGD